MVTPLYRGPDPCDLRHVALGDLVALYHRPSGATHLLASPAPEILTALAGCWCDEDGLAAALSADFELDADEGALVARLDELVVAGLVERR